MLRVKCNRCSKHGGGSGHVELARAEEPEEVLVGEGGGGGGGMRFERRQGCVGQSAHACRDGGKRARRNRTSLLRVVQVSDIAGGHVPAEQLLGLDVGGGGWGVDEMW